MQRQDLTDYIREHLDDAWNIIPANIAKKPKYAGRHIFGDVICGVAAADDPVIAALKANKDASIDMIQPAEWLTGAKSVLSFFLSFERWITEENIDGDWPSDGWLHGRIEGNAGMDKLCSGLAVKIRAEGFEAVIPPLDPRYKVIKPTKDNPSLPYSSSWSERHAAFAAGLGTFGLSRGIITEHGMSGRFMSLVTTLPMEPTPRPYTKLLEYCIKCGACIRKCPQNAISIEHLQDHALCDALLSEVRKKDPPYYGCGKCQSGVPCSRKRPVLPQTR